MSSLADYIEKYIKGLLEASSSNFVIIRRNYLADLFQCAPSQINYVLGTRFTLEKGYLVETRRGGGGFIRIARLFLPPGEMLRLLDDRMSSLNAARARAIVDQLREAELITAREARLIGTILDELMGFPGEERLRAAILKNVLLEICRFRKGVSTDDL